MSRLNAPEKDEDNSTDAEQLAEIKTLMAELQFEPEQQILDADQLAELEAELAGREIEPPHIPDPLSMKERIAGFLAKQKAGKNRSPSNLSGRQKEIGRYRREEGHDAYLEFRRATYAGKISDEENRVVKSRANLSGFTDEQKVERRRELDNALKKSIRTNLSPEEAAARRAADALRKKKARAAKKI